MKKHRPGALFVIVIATMLFAPGCYMARKTAPQKDFSYELNRPEWILEGGTKGIPAEIAGKRSTAVEACGGSAWFGIYGFGIAEMNVSRMKWNLIPLDIREVFITGFDCYGGKVYAAISGHGILEYDPATGNMKLNRNGIESETNRYYEIAALKGKIWAPTEKGLYRLDIKSGEFDVAEEGSFYTAGKNDNIFATINIGRETPYLEIFNGSSGKLEKTQKLTGEAAACGMLKLINDKAYLSIVGGIAEISLNSGKMRILRGPESLKRSRIGKVDLIANQLFLGTDAGLARVDLETNKWIMLGKDSGLPPGMHDDTATDRNHVFIATERGPFMLTMEDLKQATFLARKATATSPAGTDDGSGEVVKNDPKVSSEWVNVTIDNGLLSNSVYSLLARRDYVWVGSGVVGLSRISLEDFTVKNYSPFDKGAKDTIEAVQELALFNNRIYMAGYQYYGQFDIETEKWAGGIKRFDPAVRLDSDGLYVDADAEVMAVRKEGLRIKEKGARSWEKVEGAYLDTSPFMTDIIRIGDLYYISMDAGIQKFNLEKRKFKYLDAGVVDVKSIDGERSSLWLGARERNEKMGPRNTGLYRFNVYSENTVAYHELPGYGGTHVNQVLVDGPFVWVATDQGLYKICRMTGKWTAHSQASGIPPGKVSAISIYADMVAVGADSGVYIKPIFQFEKENLKLMYRRAWEDETAGKYIKAAREYMELAAQTGAGLADHVMYRAANSYLRGGDTKAAMNLFGRLAENNPMLVADLEGLYVEIFDYDVYVSNLMKLAAARPKDSYERAYCEIHLKGAGPALRRVALKLEKDGKKERAADYWKFISRLPARYGADEELKREANMRLGGNKSLAKATK